ncbi:MAG: substrate-binding domain-containing protein [Anaerolineaceae bacterium]|nr:substrate-binding domain-containing protein [Anaerolineaceae bacterium]
MTSKTLTTFERRQVILRILEEQSGIKVTDLAQQLDVSEGTIRNDLAALDEEQQIMRVRGGAVPRSKSAHPNQIIAARARVNFDAKQRIAQWAAGLVENGDSIILDASTTVLHMAEFLQNRRNLTVVTNGLEIARRLAESPSNTVILVGGVLRSDGNAVTGLLGTEALRDLHVRTAFVSCAGFSWEAGFMEFDIPQAQIKHTMIQSAQRIVALVDSSKFEQLGLTPFATLADIHHVVTDQDVESSAITRLQNANINVTVCTDHASTTYAPDQALQKKYKIGFANMSEDMPFPRDVRRGLERAAQNTSQIELFVANNQMSAEIASEVADNLIASGIDLMIEFQIVERVGNILMNKFNQAGIPVIAIDIPMVGATFFGVDNYQTGYVAGIELGKAVEQEWRGEFDRLIILEHPRAGYLPASRIKGQIDGFQEIVGEVNPDKMIYRDSGNTTSVSETQMLQVFQELPDEHRLPVICFNDDAAIGAVDAARKVHRTGDILAIGQGADRRMREELRKGSSRIVGSTSFHPELYGEKLIDLALHILKGEPVPPAVYMEYTFVNAANVDLLYFGEKDER